ncbi:hypothetical protein ACFX14_008820 [Malus domestica]
MPASASTESTHPERTHAYVTGFLFSLCSWLFAPGDVADSVAQDEGRRTLCCLQVSCLLFNLDPLFLPQ